MVHDTDAEGCEFALDAMLFCGCKDWKMEYGGHTTYIAKGEDEEVATSLFLLSIFIINLCMSDNGAISVTVVENYYNDV